MVSAQTQFSPAAVCPTRASLIAATTALVFGSIRLTPVHEGAHRLLSAAASGMVASGALETSPVDGSTDTTEPPFIEMSTHTLPCTWVSSVAPSGKDIGCPLT